jgi:hypothetical protein
LWARRKAGQGFYVVGVEAVSDGSKEVGGGEHVVVGDASGGELGEAEAVQAGGAHD